MAIVYCGQRSQHLWSHTETFHIHRSHSLSFLDMKAFMKSKRCYLWLENITDYCRKLLVLICCHVCGRHSLLLQSWIIALLLWLWLWLLLPQLLLRHISCCGCSAVTMRSAAAVPQQGLTFLQQGLTILKALTITILTGHREASWDFLLIEFVVAKSHSIRKITAAQGTLIIFNNTNFMNLLEQP